MHSIGEDGLRKVLSGMTTLDEVSRVVYLAQQAGKVCPACSTVLNREFEYCPTCGEFVGEHCEACHRRLSQNWAYCPHCGNDTAQESESAEGPKRSRRRRRALSMDEAMKRAS